MASRWQIIALFSKDPITAMIAAVGDAYTEIVRITGDQKNSFGLATYGINFEATADDSFIAGIADAALKSMQAGKSGSPGISMADYFFIMRCLEQGEAKLAEVYLSYREKQEKDLIDQRAAQMQEMNTQGAQALEQQKAQNAQMLTQLEIQKDIAVLQEKGRQERLTITHELSEAKRLGVQQQSIA